MESNGRGNITFGLVYASAPEAVRNCLLFYLKLFISSQNYKIRELLYLLDDFLSIDSPGDEGIRSMCLLTRIFSMLNIPIYPDKTLVQTLS